MLVFPCKNYCKAIYKCRNIETAIEEKTIKGYYNDKTK